MADLDDFFAKKDRKKAKGKKFTTTEEIAKKLEETGKRIEKPKPKEKPTNPEGEEVQQVEVNSLLFKRDENNYVQSFVTSFRNTIRKWISAIAMFDLANVTPNCREIDTIQRRPPHGTIIENFYST